jgi:DinB superfamily
MSGYALELIDAIDKATPYLTNLSDEESIRPCAPGKWCPREVVGHLVDSASNNHQRFVRAQLQEDLVFPGYEQDLWVAAQGYRGAPWQDLVVLWRSFNLHLARLMDLTPRDQLEKPRRHHNLDVIGWKPIPKDQPATLGYFMADYVAHLKHHLRQINALD